MVSAKELGERKIIQLITTCLEPMPNAPIPFGDDASAIDLGNNKLVVINTDMLVAKTDVPESMTLWQAARKAVIMNISDLAAKGTKPTAVLASLGLPENLTEEEIIEIGKGLNAGAKEYGTYVIGGDTNQAQDVTINCVALGICQSGHLIKRSGAKAGDIVAVTGAFGKTAAGLKILIANLSGPDDSGALVDSVLMPRARVKEGVALAQSQTATASIDTSDGLAWSLHELSQASGVGFCLDYLPVAVEAENFAKHHGFDPNELALYGGEEYELLVTINPQLWKKAKQAVETVGGELIKIGVATEQKQVIIKTGNGTVAVEARGWEHFKT